MFIQTEDTPNPNALKFIPGVKISPGNPVNFKSKTECTNSPLASELFKIKYVKSVFFGEDFITITKQEDKSWDVIKAEILLTIMETLSANMPIFIKDKEEKHSKDDDFDSDIVVQIKELIEHRIRPAVAQDGGDIVFHSFENGVLKLKLHGACSSCPSSTVTLKDGIENMLRHYVPEVESVEAINEQEEGYGHYAKD